MQRVEGPRAGELGDVGCGLTGDAVELHDPERGDVVDEGAFAAVARSSSSRARLRRASTIV